MKFHLQRLQELCVRGFTMVELLIAGAGFLVVGGILTVLYMTQFQSFSILMSRSTVTNTLRSVTEQIERDIQQATLRETTGPCVVTYGGRLVLNVTQPELPGVQRIVYRCNPTNGCVGTSASIGALERLLFTSATCATPQIQTRQLTRAGEMFGLISHQPCQADDPGAPDGGNSSVQVTLHMQSTMSRYTTSGKLIVCHNLQN